MLKNSFRGNQKTRDADIITINEAIKFSELRVYLPDSNSEVMSKNQALELANSYGLDLVLVTEQATPPVCRIVDVGKYQYEIKQREKEAKKRQREAVAEQKEIRLGLNIGQHDMETKAKQTRKFLAENSKVTVVVILRGRERGRQDLARDLLNNFAHMLGVEYEQVSSQNNRVVAKIK
jgi:translation initiation factor IF-3